MNFLVVDDKDTVGRTVIDLLKGICLEFTVVVAVESKEALSKMTSAGFRLIVNLDMENSEGSKFIRTIKGNKVLAKKKIIAISSVPSKYRGKFDSSTIILDLMDKKKIIEELKNQGTI